MLTASCIGLLYINSACAIGDPMIPLGGNGMMVEEQHFDKLARYITSYYVDAINAFIDFMFQFDKRIPEHLYYQDLLNKAIEEQNKNSQNYVQNAIALSLSDIVTQSEHLAALNKQLLASDNDAMPTQAKTYLTNIYKSTNATTSIPSNAKSEHQEGDKNFSIETLLGPDVYSDDQQKQTALNYIQMMEASAPTPTVLRIGEVFTVPYPVDTENQDGIKTVILDQKNSNKNLTELNKYLANNPEYQAYQEAYRATIAARSPSVAILANTYYARNKLSKGDIPYSKISIEKEHVAKYLSEDYHSDMASTSPAVREQEMIQLLAEINYSLYQLRQNSEFMMVMQALSNLQASAINNVLLKQTVQTIGKNIYCNYSKDANCGSNKKNSSGAPNTQDMTNALNK